MLVNGKRLGHFVMGGFHDVRIQKERDFCLAMVSHATHGHHHLTPREHAVMVHVAPSIDFRRVCEKILVIFRQRPRYASSLGLLTPCGGSKGVYTLTVAYSLTKLVGQFVHYII